MKRNPDTLRARCERLLKKWRRREVRLPYELADELTGAADELAAALKPKKARKRK